MQRFCPPLLRPVTITFPIKRGLKDAHKKGAKKPSFEVRSPDTSGRRRETREKTRFRVFLLGYDCLPDEKGTERGNPLNPLFRGTVVVSYPIYNKSVIHEDWWRFSSTPKQ